MALYGEGHKNFLGKHGTGVPLRLPSFEGRTKMERSDSFLPSREGIKKTKIKKTKVFILFFMLLLHYSMSKHALGIFRHSDNRRYGWMSVTERTSTVTLWRIISSVAFCIPCTICSSDMIVRKSIPGDTTMCFVTQSLQKRSDVVFPRLRRTTSSDVWKTAHPPTLSPGIMSTTVRMTSPGGGCGRPSRRTYRVRTLVGMYP